MTTEMVECIYCQDMPPLLYPCPVCGGTKKMPWIYRMVKPDIIKNLETLSDYAAKQIAQSIDDAIINELVKDSNKWMK